MNTAFYQFVCLLGLTALFMNPASMNAQSTEKLLTIRTLEVIDDTYQGKIVIVDEDGKVTELKLLKFKPGVFAENSKRIHEAINDVLAKGYKMVGSSGGAGQIFLITTYLFQKEELKK
jgi:hypothetical protein